MARPRPWDPAAQRTRAERRALAELVEQQQADTVGAYQLVRAVIEQAVSDLRTGGRADLEDALLYLLAPRGEFATWHADAVGLDLGAVRERAKRIIVERFGPEAGAALWERLSRLAGGKVQRGRRVA